MFPRRPRDPRRIKNSIRIEVNAIRYEWMILTGNHSDDTLQSACRKLQWVIIRNNLEDAILNIVRHPCVLDRRIGMLQRDTVAMLFQKFSNLWDNFLLDVINSPDSGDYNWSVVFTLFHRLWKSIWNVNQNLKICENTNK